MCASANEPIEAWASAQLVVLLKAFLQTLDPENYN
jgi:hypothetical protein